jgi:hypothetical protein
VSEERMGLGISDALKVHHTPTVISCSGISYVSLGLSADWYPIFSAFLWPFAYR